jgi:hypothetical protein
LFFVDLLVVVTIYRSMRTPTHKPIRHHVLGVRVTSELKEAIEAAAAVHEWSVSHWLAMAAQATLDAEKHPRRPRGRPRKAS